MNLVILIGTLTKKSELKVTSTGLETVSFTIETLEQEKYKTYHNCVAWRQNAVNMNLASIGDQITVNGRIQNRKYEDKTGNTRYITEVVANTLHIGKMVPTDTSMGNKVTPSYHETKPFKQEDKLRVPKQNFDIEQDLPF